MTIAATATARAGQSVLHRPRHRSSPRVRRLAAELSVDLRAVSGTGPAGRVTTDDLARYISGPGAAPAPVSSRTASAPPPGTMSGRTTGDGGAMVEIDVGRLGRGGDELLAVVARAALESGRQLGVLAAFHGVAVLRGDGTWVTIPNAADLTDDGMARRLVGAGATAPGDLPPLSVVSSHGATVAWPPLGPGEAVRFALGAVVDRPVVMRDADGAPMIAVRPMAHLTVAYDGAALDGKGAARWLAVLRDGLERRGHPAGRMG